MSTLYLDLETYSEADLSSCGAWVYSRHPSTEVLLFAYALDDAPVRLWDCMADPDMPDDLARHLADPDVVLVAHNAQFDRWIIENVLRIRPALTRWRCTMAKAYTVGLPGKLEQLGAALGLDDDLQKLREGARLIRLFSMPQRPRIRRRQDETQEEFEARYAAQTTRATAETHPEDWERFREYAIRDVESLREIDRRLPGWNYQGEELALWHLDQKINDRGLPVDLKLARLAAELCDAEQDRLNAELSEITDGAVTSHSRRDAVMAWIRSRGVNIKGYTKADISGLLERPDLPADVRRVLEIRQEAGRTSTAKYVAFARVADPEDHRIRGAFQYAGASRTMRWCLTGDHEVLTPHGWERLDTWTGGEIAQWRSGTVFFAHASKVEFDYEGDLIEVHRDGRISAAMTPEHKLCRPAGAQTAGEAYGKNVSGIPRGGVLNRDPCNTIRTRVLVMLQHDGYDGTAFGSGITWKFTKQRKFTRCQKLLAAAGVPFTARRRDDGVFVVSVKKSEAPDWLRKRDFGPWLLEERHDPRTFIDEIQYWDGGNRRDKQIEVCAKERVNAEWTCTMAHLAGFAGTLTQRSNGYWYANISKSGNGVSIKPADWSRRAFQGKVYCPVTESGYFLVRRRGIVHVTGNSGRNVQPQNLPRPTIDDTDTAAEAVLSGTAELLYDNLMEVGASVVRSVIAAPKGRILVAGDYSNIEGRVLAWLAGEEWKLQAFRDFDAGIGHDIYKQAYSRTFGVPVESVTADQRQVGKVEELAFGYQGSVGAFRQFGDAFGVGKDMTDEEILVFVRGWRQGHPATVSWWYELEEAAIRAVRNPGKAFRARKVAYKVQRYGKNVWLLCRLPSGRFLTYFAPRLTHDGRLQYEGLDQKTRRWVVEDSYGGKLAENCTQAVARDLMAANMPHVERAGFEIIGTVHDEIITEVPEGSPAHGAADLERAMTFIPPWAEGMPLVAGAYTSRRYRKG